MKGTDGWKRGPFLHSNDGGDVSEEAEKYIEVAATHANKLKETLVAKHTKTYKTPKTHLQSHLNCISNL